MQKLKKDILSTKQFEKAKKCALDGYIQSQKMSKYGEGCCLLDFEDKALVGIKLVKTGNDGESKKKKCSIGSSVSNYLYYSKTAIKAVVIVEEEDGKEPCQQCLQWLSICCKKEEQIPLARFCVDKHKNFILKQFKIFPSCTKKQLEKQEKQSGGLGKMLIDLW